MKAGFAGVYMKVNIKKLISFIFLFVLLIFMFLFNRRRAVLFFIIAMLLYLASAVLLFMPWFSLPEISLFMRTPEQQAGEDNVFVCRLKCRNFYPFSRIKIVYGIKHRIETEYSYIETYYNIYQGVKDNSLDFNFSFCGVYEIACTEARVYDLLGLFSKRISNIAPANAVVLPKDNGLRFNAEKLVLDDEEDVYTDPYAGSDVSEIKELRDYRAGDRLSQIHWKLSTKSEDLIVKEYAKNAGVCVVLACDGSYKTPSELTAYFEHLLSFGKSMLEDDMFFELVYFNASEEDAVSRKIDNLYNLTLTMQEMFFNLKAVEKEVLEAYYNRSGSAYKLLYLTMNREEDSSYKYIFANNGAAVVSEI